MSWHALGHFLKDAAPVVAMFTSLFLLWQGQRDRRRLALERRRDQVDQLVLSVGLEFSSSRGERVLTLRNESSALLEILEVYGVSPTTGDADGPYRLDLARWPALLIPGEAGETGFGDYWDKSVVSGEKEPYCVVLVRDAHGRTWRKRSDTAASKLVHYRTTPPGRARLALWLERHWWGRPCWWALYGPLDRRLSRMRDRDPERSPRVLRVSRWVWGCWDVGINDPWVRPGIVPWKSARRKKQ